MIRFSRKPWKEIGFDIYSQETYKKLRLGYRNYRGEFIPPQLTEGLEWSYHNSRVCVYNLDLLESFFENRKNPRQHLENVENYFANQQRLKRNRKQDKSSGGAA